MPDPATAPPASLYTAARAFFRRSSLPALTSADAPPLPTASVRATANAATASLYAYRTNVRYPRNDPRAAAVGFAAYWGGFGTARARPAGVYALAHPVPMRPAAAAVGSAQVSAAANGPDVAEVTRGAWRVVVYCSGNSATDLSLAELTAASLPPPPAWATDPTVDVCA